MTLAELKTEIETLKKDIALSNNQIKIGFMVMSLVAFYEEYVRTVEKTENEKVKAA